MRTTVTLDDDIAEKVQEKALETGKSFKQVLNDALRLGLVLEASFSVPREPFQVKAHRLGLKHGMSYVNVAELIEQLEGPGHC